MAATATQEKPSGAWEAHDKAALSREINRGIEIKQQIKDLDEELKQINARIYDAVSGAPGLYRSNKGHVELKVSRVLTVPLSNQDALAGILGDRYPDLVEETLKLGAKAGLRRLLFEPGPHETELCHALKDIVSWKEQPSFSYKGFGKL